MCAPDQRSKLPVARVVGLSDRDQRPRWCSRVPRCGWRCHVCRFPTVRRKCWVNVESDRDLGDGLSSDRRDGPMAHEVFVSYSHHDKPQADAVCATLEAKGIRCWIAPRDVIPGQEWGAAIVNAIRSARVMVLVFSSHANASPQIRREVERAVNAETVLIPFRIEDVAPAEALEFFLGAPHWLDALTPPLDAHLERLAAAVMSFLSVSEPVGSSTCTTMTPHTGFDTDTDLTATPSTRGGEQKTEEALPGADRTEAEKLVRHPAPRVGADFGPYRLRRLLGRGTMGEVYEAENSRTARIVAVRVLSATVSSDPIFRARLQREARATAKLQEPHVLPIHDFGEIDGVMYVEMRLIDGMDLRTMLKRYGQMTPTSGCNHRSSCLGPRQCPCNRGHAPRLEAREHTDHPRRLCICERLRHPQRGH
jgi:TIR domain/Protein kinase domain